MTSYHITVGYNAGHSPQKVGEKLKSVVAELRENPWKIAAEAMRIEGGSLAEMTEYAELYRPPDKDLSVRVTDEGGALQIIQLASGGSPEREKKEAVRRAFGRLVLEGMHAVKMEVNFNVY